MSKVNKKKRALLTGISGQDGAYLARWLLNLDYEVYGLVRRKSDPSNPKLTSIINKITLIDGDLTEYESVRKVIAEVNPDEVYNLGAQSHVGYSFKVPITTITTSGLAVWYILEAIKEINPDIKLYQASTSELFGGDPKYSPQGEDTIMEPNSPYAAAKLLSFNGIKLYRESYGMFACNGILFNHESPFRGLDFVTRKITNSVARILAQKQDKLELGNLDAKRDWGFAPEYIQAMHLLLQQDSPEDFVIGTGETHTIKEFIDEICDYLNEDIHKYVEINPAFLRPREVNVLCADNTKAKEILGWEPKIKFKELVHIMMDSDLELNGLSSPGEGAVILKNNNLEWSI